jgi:hypothetical protein
MKTVRINREQTCDPPFSYVTGIFYGIGSDKNAGRFGQGF